jgi:hypothetical protein
MDAVNYHLAPGYATFADHPNENRGIFRGIEARRRERRLSLLD